MTVDFRADQIRTNKIIASGSSGTGAQLMIYSVSASSNLQGGIDSSKFVTTGIGTDVFMFVTGAIGSIGTSVRGTSLFGGDLVVSGNLKFIGSLIGNPVTAPSASIVYASASNIVTGDSFLTYNATNRILALSGSGNLSASFYVGIDRTVSTPSVGGIGMAYGSKISGRDLNSNNWRDLVAWGANGQTSQLLLIGESTINTVALSASGSVALLLSSSRNYVSGTTHFPQGLSGSLTALTDGTQYLIAGVGMTIVTGANGAITINGGTASLNVPTNAIAFGIGTTVTGSSNLNFVSGGNLMTLTGTLYMSGTILANTLNASTIIGPSASMILGSNKMIFGEESGTNVQRRIAGITSSNNIITFGDANNIVQTSGSIIDMYTNALRRFRISNAGAISFGALVGDSGLGGSLTLGNNTPIYWQDSGGTARSILAYDASNIITIGENATNIAQVKFTGVTTGIYATFSRSFTLAMGNDEIGLAGQKPDGTIRGADQPNGSVTNQPGAKLIIRPGLGSGTGATGSVLIRGTTVTGSGTNIHGVRDVANFHGSYGMQLTGIASASLPAAATSFTGSLQYTSDTNQLFLMSGSVWREITTTPTRLTVAGALTTYATSSTPAMAGQFEFDPADFGAAPKNIYFRAILSVNPGTNVTGGVTLYNLTSGSYVDIGGVGNILLTTTASNPLLFTSVNLRSAANFATGSALYEVRTLTSNILSASTMGIAEIVIR